MRSHDTVCISIIMILCTCCIPAAGQVRAVWYHTTPMVVNPSCPQAVIFEVRIEGAPTEVRLCLGSDGREILLFDNGLGIDKTAGDGVYTTTLDMADIVYGFTAEDVNRNFIGYLRLYVGSTRAAQYNLFFDILTDDIPEVGIQHVSDDVQYTPHLVNIVYPDFFEDFLISAVLQQFYTRFGDDYDFVNVIYGIAYFANRYHFVIRNNVQGIGPGMYNNTATYGSSGRLLGCTVFPIPGLFDGASPDYQHELGHQWINYLPVPPLDVAIAHWPLSDLASGIMGWAQSRGGQGLNFNYDLEPTGDDYLMIANREPKVFKDLDLYLMGLVGPDQVSEHFVFDNQAQSLSGNLLHGPVTTVTIDDIMAQVGLRVPDHASSPKKFTIASLIVSRDGLLSEETLRFYDYFSARAMGEQIVPYASGFAQGQTKPFYLSTAGLGRLDARIIRSEGPCVLGDDVSLDMEDLQVLANHWLESCSGPSWCDGADYNHSGHINGYDFACLARHWRTEDASCGFWQQASYAGDCLNRPAGTVCVAFSDGYLWLLSEGPVAWDTDIDCQGRKVEIVHGGSGTDYYHILDTNLVKVIKSGH